MLAPAVKVMTEFKPLLMKIHQDAMTKKPKKISTTCDSHLTDVKIIVGLTYLLPMLRATNKVMKFAQAIDMIVCDFLVAIKKLQLDLTMMYIKETTKFKSEAFWDFNALVEVRHDAIPMKWVIEEELDLNAS
jgi:membrane protein CcdC involved in cytochrome C biogenesis